MQLKSIRIAQFLCASVFIFLPLFSISQEINPYEKNIRRFDEMMYLYSSSWVNNKDKAWDQYIEKVNKAGFDFQLKETRNPRYMHDSFSLLEGVSATYFESAGKEWVYELTADDDLIKKQYDKIREFWAKQREKGMSGVGENANYGKYSRFGQFITFKTGEDPASLNLYILKEAQILVMGIDLGFPILVQYDELNQEQRIKVRDQYDRLQIMLDYFSDTFIPEEAWLKKPLRGKRLTAEQRLYGFTQFWTEVKYNFAFFDQVPDLDWDKVLYEYLPIIQKDQSNEEYFKTLKLICAKLGDGHTNIYPPTENIDMPGLRLKNFGNKAFVVNTKDSLLARIPLGSEIIAVEGITTEQYLRDRVFPYISSSTDHIRYNWGIRDLLDGERNSEVQFEIRLPNGEVRKEQLKRNRQEGGDWVKGRKGWRLFEFSKTEGDFAHVKLNSFSRENIIEEFEKRIDSIKDCKGVIIDLRENGGGSSGIGYAILNHFTQKTYKGSQWRTREHRASYKAWGKFVDESLPFEELSESDKRAKLTLDGEYWYVAEPSEYKSEVKEIIELPVVVLIGNNTASAAEDFLVALDQVGIAKLIGSPTFGSTGQPLMMDLPGGGSARICTKRDTYPDGREFVGYGIPPDYKVEQTVEDYLNDKDVVLEYAVKYLKENPNFGKGKK
ncbi:MAG: S41 family peptidase [Bacteroidota bacterium]